MPRGASGKPFSLPRCRADGDSDRGPHENAVHETLVADSQATKGGRTAGGTGVPSGTRSGRSGSAGPRRARGTLRRPSNHCRSWARRGRQARRLGMDVDRPDWSGRSRCRAPAASKARVVSHRHINRDVGHGWHNCGVQSPGRLAHEKPARRTTRGVGTPGRTAPRRNGRGGIHAGHARDAAARKHVAIGGCRQLIFARGAWRSRSGTARDAALLCSWSPTTSARTAED
jgi:hypothetical protein